ncbi:MAG: 4-phosphoerythronate dehydrogenase PdxB [Terriglobia bacterium]
MKIVADDKIPYLKGVLEPFAQVRYLPGAKIGRPDVQDADALITRTRTRCNADLLEDTRVRFIASATIGFDHIDAEYCRRRQITWTNAAGCNAGSVTQWVAAALATLARRFQFRLEGKTLGIVGVGHVGSRVESLAQALGMRLLRNDPPRMRTEGAAGFVSLEQVLAEADIITLHVPLSLEGSDRTLRLVDRDRIARMKPGTLLLNSSRGEVADSAALKEALRSGVLRAALDVWENEPGIDAALLDRVILATPHIAGYSADGKANGTAMSVQAVSRFFGLGLDEWYPASLPAPQCPILRMDCANKTREEVLRDAIHATYEIEADDDRLRRSVETFEAQRESYPVRREFFAYRVQSANASDSATSALKSLGFQLLSG